MTSTIESLDDTLMHYILRFLCGPKPECIEAYTADLLHCERVCKWFHNIIADDKLWGYWSVLDDPNNDGNQIYLTVPDYGPDKNEYYDERLNSWRDLTQCKAVLERIPRMMRNCEDEKIFGFENETDITYVLADCMFETLAEHFFDILEFDGILETLADYSFDASIVALKLRKDSAQMLFTIVGQYIEALFRCATVLVLHSDPIHEKKRYPTVNDLALRDAAQERPLSFPDGLSIIPNLSPEGHHHFDILIRRIAYRAGTVKLDTNAFALAKSLYCHRLRDMLKYACTMIVEDGERGSYRDGEKKKICNAADAFHIHPGLRLLKTVEYCDCVINCPHYEHIFIPVPGQFEDANQLLSNQYIKPRVYGVEDTTLSLTNLHEDYEIENDDEENDDLHSDYEPDTDEDTEDEDEELDFISDNVLEKLDMISEKLDDLKTERFEIGTLNRDDLMLLISELQVLSLEN
jgi:hypothetical protein